MNNPIVEIFEIINYIGEGSRPFKEGSLISNSNNILLCGFRGSQEENVKTDKYFALCLQSSHLTDYPHEININISWQNNNKKINAHCSCQAGNSGTCKHVTGVLLLLNRKTKETIENIGCTDLRQQWGKINKKVSEAYAADPVKNFCHGAQALKNYDKTPELRKQIFKNKNLLEANDESELSQHTRCNRNSLSEKEKISCANSKIKNLNSLLNKNDNKCNVVCDLSKIYAYSSKVNQELLDRLGSSIWSKYLVGFKMNMRYRNLAMYYNKRVALTDEKAKDIFISTVTQNNEIWYFERFCRITGSISYQLFTYMKHFHTDDEWDKKLCGIYKSNFKGNEHTFRGQENEQKAKVAYEKLTGKSIQNVGLFILKTSPWFGYSPDGVANNNVLIEIKCPKNDLNLKAEDLLIKLPFINHTTENKKLKSHHQYFGQVQLGMALLDLKTCDFVVYENKNDTCAIIQVERDEKFLQDFLPTLSTCYFERILPWLVKEDTNFDLKKN